MNINQLSNHSKIDAIVVAGEGESSYKVYHRHKAFLKIKGKCIINYVVEALQQVEGIDSIYVVGLKNELKQTLSEGSIDLHYPKKIHIIEQKANLYENIWHSFLLTVPGGSQAALVDNSPFKDKTVLIVPCDAPLLTPHEVDHFISTSDMENYDHVLGLVSEKTLEPFYPRENQLGIKMAYLHIKEKNYRINNLHLVKPLRIGNREYIQQMYQYRYQRNFKNLILFGLSLIGKDKAEHFKYYLGLQFCLFAARLGINSAIKFFRRWTPRKDLERCISTIMETRFTTLECPYPGAALDIDNDKDYEAMNARFDEWADLLHRSEHSLP